MFWGGMWGFWRVEEWGSCFIGVFGKPESTFTLSLAELNRRLGIKKIQSGILVTSIGAITGLG